MSLRHPNPVTSEIKHTLDNLIVYFLAFFLSLSPPHSPSLSLLLTLFLTNYRLMTHTSLWHLVRNWLGLAWLSPA